MHIEDLWQLRWNRSLTGCVTHSYIPVVSNNIILPRLRCSAISYTRLLLGDTTWMFIWNAWAWQSHGSVIVEWELTMSTIFFLECPYYHEFRQLLEQSVQDTLLTGRKFVAANLSVSLLLAPWTNNSLPRRQCKDILEATLEYIQRAGRRLWSASQFTAHFCI